MKVVLILIFLIFYLKSGQSLYQASAFVRQIKPEKGIWVVNYYSPKSQGSRKFAPEFIKAARMLKHIVKFASIDVSQQTTDVDFNSCPLLRLYADDKVYNYVKPLRASQIVNFVKKLLPQIISNRVQSSSSVKTNSLSSTIGTSQIKAEGKDRKLLPNKDGSNNKASTISTKTLPFKYQSNFKTALEIASPVPMNMQIISDQVISQKK